MSAGSLGCWSAVAVYTFPATDLPGSCRTWEFGLGKCDASSSFTSLSQWQAPPTRSGPQGFSEYLVRMYAFYFIWHIDSPWATGHLLIPQASAQRLRQMPRSTSPSTASVQRLRRMPPSSIPNIPGTKHSCPSCCRSASPLDTSVTPCVCSVSLVSPFNLSIQHLWFLYVLTDGSRSLPQ